MSDERADRHGSIERRRIVQAIGGLGAAGLAGCLGGDDSGGDSSGDDANGGNGDDSSDDNGGDDNGGDAENGDDNGADPDPAFFEVNDLEPGNREVLHTEAVEFSATIENTGEEEGTQTVLFVFDGETEDSTSVTLDGEESEPVSFEVDGWENLDFTLYDYEITSQDDAASATIDIEPDYLQAPYGVNFGGEPEEEEQQSELPVVIDGLEFEDVNLDDIDDLDYVTFYGEEHPEEDWWEPPVDHPPESDQEVQGTDHPALYHTYFFGWNFDVEFTIENGIYDVTIHNSENWFGEDAANPDDLPGEGSRVFDIIVQGETVVEEYDIFAEAGGHHIPHTITVEDVEVEDETLLIETETHEDFSKIAAIEIR